MDNLLKTRSVHPILISIWSSSNYKADRLFKNINSLMKCYLMIGSAVIKVKFEIAHAQCLMGGSHCKATDLFNSYFPEWKPQPSRVKCLNLRMCHPIYYID